MKGRIYILEGGEYVARSKIVWIRHNGPIPKGYVIHHKDRIPDHDNIDNLQAVTKSEHWRIHNVAHCENGR